MKLPFDKSLASLAAKSLRWLQSLSSRERLLILGGVLIIGFAVILNLTQTVVSAYQEQALEIAAAETDMETAKSLLRAQTRLIQQRNLLEERYRKIEFREGPLSYIEGLITDKLSLPSTKFSINPKTPQPFGREFEQSTFNLKFRVNSLEKLVNFLSSLNSKEKPMIISKLDMSKSADGNNLDVALEVSCIHKPLDKGNR